MYETLNKALPFSAFWPISSVVSILIRLISDTWPLDCIALLHVPPTPYQIKTETYCGKIWTYGASPWHRALSPILHQQFDRGPRRVFCRAGSDRWLRSYDRVDTREHVPKVCKVRLTVHLKLIGTTVISLDSLHVRSCYVHLRLHCCLNGLQISMDYPKSFIWERN